MARSYDFQRKEDEDKKERESSKSSPRGRQNVTIPADLAAQGLIDFRPFASIPVSTPPTAPGSPVADTIALFDGNNQSRVVGSDLLTRLAVLVTDSTTTPPIPVSGITVVWSIDGDADVTPFSVTDSVGMAYASVILGTRVGAYTITATVDGLSGSPVTFSADAIVGPATSIEAVSAVAQSGTISAPVTSIPTVLVTDEFRNPVEGVTVTFAITNGSGSINDASDDSNSAGVASCDGWTLGAAAGLNTVTATAVGLAGSPVTFSADASATNAPTQIALTAGSGQSPVAGAAISTPFQFTVKDAGDAAVEGVTVSFTTNGGTLSVASAVTDASGQVSVTLTTPTDVRTTTVTASFINASNTAITAVGTVLSVAGVATKVRKVTAVSSNGISGEVFTQQPSADLEDVNSNRVLTATDNFTLSIASGNGELSGTLTVAAVNGLATWTDVSCSGTGDQQLRATAAGFNGVVGTITLAPPLADHLEEVQAPQDVLVDVVLSPDPSVRVADHNGLTIPNDTSAVTVSLNGSGSLSGILTRNCVTGVATFPGLSIDTAGTKNLIYTRSGLSNSPLTSSSFVVSTPGGGGGTHPNEPAGFTAFTTLDGLLRPDLEDGWSLTSGGSHFATVARTGAERAISTSQRLNYAGTSVGNAPTTISKNLPITATELYLDFDYCYESDYNAHQAENKVFFICGGQTAGGNPGIFDMHRSGGGYGPLQPGFALESGVPGVGGNSNPGGNRRVSSLNGGDTGAHSLPRDAVARFELYIKLNTNGAADGIIKCWMGLNGAVPTLLFQATNMAYRGAGASVGGNEKIRLWKWSPTYGGRAAPLNGDPVQGHVRLGYGYGSYKA